MWASTTCYPNDLNTGNIMHHVREFRNVSRARIERNDRLSLVRGARSKYYTKAEFVVHERGYSDKCPTSTFKCIVVCCFALPSARADPTLYDQLRLIPNLTDYIVNRDGSVINSDINIPGLINLASHLNNTVNAVNTVNTVDAVKTVNTTFVDQQANATAVDLTKGGIVIYSDANIFPIPSTEKPLNNNNRLEDFINKMQSLPIPSTETPLNNNLLEKFIKKILSFKKDNLFNTESEELRRTTDEETAKKTIQDMEKKKFEILMDMFH